MFPSKRLVATGDVLDGLEILIIYLTNDPPRKTHHNHTVGDDEFRGQQRAGRNDTSAADPTTVEQDGPRANEGLVPDATAVHDGPVRYGNTLTDAQGPVVRCVEDGSILNVAAVSDPYRGYVPADDHLMHNGHFVADRDVSAYIGGRGYVNVTP